MRTYLALVLLAGTAACVREPDPFEYAEPSISVHGLLSATDDSVAVSILRGVGEIQDGASVIVRSGATQVVLTHAASDSSCYIYFPVSDQVEESCYVAALPQPVAPGTRWTLEADVEPGYDVTGSTTIPATPFVLRPAPRERIPYAGFGSGQPTPITVEWQTAAAPRVEVRLSEGRAYRAGALLPTVRCMLYDDQVGAAVGQPSGTRQVNLHDVYCSSPTVSPVTWDSVVAEVLVTAFDSAYAEFALHGSSVTRSRGASLQGAYGVFGSAATARREVVIVQN